LSIFLGHNRFQLQSSYHTALHKYADEWNVLMSACELLTWCTFWNVVTSFFLLNVPQVQCVQ
jgi:hypothetical protein